MNHSEELITSIDALGYEMWWHLPRLYNPKNFAKNKQNIFVAMISINLLSSPKEAVANVTGLRPVTGPMDWCQL